MRLTRKGSCRIQPHALSQVRRRRSRRRNSERYTFAGRNAARSKHPRRVPVQLALAAVACGSVTRRLPSPR